MLHGWWRLALVLCVPCIALIGTIRAQTLTTAVPDDWLDGTNCTAPCWQGIQPGITPSFQAINLLNQHPWVDRVWGVSSGRWSWSGTQPAWIDARRPGTMSIRYGLVEQISIPTRLSTGDFWIMTSPLEKGVVFTSGLTSRAYNYADAGDFWIVSDLRCPITRRDFWNAPVLILLGDMREFEQQNAHHHNDYALPGWSRGVSC